jgi:hypothetical protein
MAAARVASVLALSAPCRLKSPARWWPQCQRAPAQATAGAALVDRTDALTGGSRRSHGGRPPCGSYPARCLLNTHRTHNAKEYGVTDQASIGEAIPRAPHWLL